MIANSLKSGEGQNPRAHIRVSSSGTSIGDNGGGNGTVDTRQRIILARLAALVMSRTYVEVVIG